MRKEGRERGREGREIEEERRRKERRQRRGEGEVGKKHESLSPFEKAVFPPQSVPLDRSKLTTH